MKSTAYSLFSAMLLVAAVAHGGAETATSPKAPAAPPSMQRENSRGNHRDRGIGGSGDPDHRMRGEEGRTGAFTAGPEVKNFPQIRVGDKVVVSYYRGIAAEVLPPRARRCRRRSTRSTWPRRRSRAPSPAPASAPPRAARWSIEKVDTKANDHRDLQASRWHFAHPAGGERGGPTFIAKLKKGDKVDVVYVEAVAVEVRPQSKAATTSRCDNARRRAGPRACRSLPATSARRTRSAPSWRCRVRTGRRRS